MELEMLQTVLDANAAAHEAWRKCDEDEITSTFDLQIASELARGCDAAMLRAFSEHGPALISAARERYALRERVRCCGKMLEREQDRIQKLRTALLSILDRDRDAYTNTDVRRALEVDDRAAKEKL